MLVSEFRSSRACSSVSVQGRDIFKIIVLDSILGKVKYPAIRVEFQLRGRPHIQSFLWTLDAPVLRKNNIDEYVRFVDSIVKAIVPNEVKDPEIFQLVTTYQVHSHSRSCRKYKKGKSRYHFGKLFTENIIVASSLPSDLSDEMKNSILSEREKMLSKVKEYIDKNLDPKKTKYFELNKK